MPPKMPPAGRTTRQRLVANENDENSNSTRITRAKAAALSVDELSMPAKGAKKAATTTTAAGGQRKRAALGDVSNYKKLEIGGEGKKAGVGKTGLVSKAAQPSGVQKNKATRTALTSKETNKKLDKPEKRSGSGSSTIGGSLQKRKVSASAAIKEEVVEEEEAEGAPARKKAHTTESEKKIKAESKKASKSNVVEDDAEVEPEEPVPFEYPPGVRDLDSEDLEDPLMVAEYSNEIFNYLRDLETQSMPNPQYMDHQDDLEWKTRGILVDWLIEVHTRFHLLPETLFLAVNMIDRFLSEKVVQLDRLQLVGVTAMFIASKYEEVLSPHVANFRHVSDDGFSEAEILSAERFILSTLNYDLSYPNPMNFLRRISKADNYDIQCRTIGKYLMEISLLDHRFMSFRPSHVAAGAMYMARMMLDRGDWDETLAFYSGYTEKEIEPVYELMLDYLLSPIRHEAFFKKYASKKFLKASLVTRSWAQKHARTADSEY